MTDQEVKAKGKAASKDDVAEAPDPFEVTQAEIDAWAQAERARRKAWLDGPTEDERAAYALRARRRRIADAFDEGELRIERGMRQGLRYGRESQLAAEGAMRTLYRWSRRTFTELAQAGREWEEETSLPGPRRRVPLDDDVE